MTKKEWLYTGATVFAVVVLLVIFWRIRGTMPPTNDQSSSSLVQNAYGAGFNQQPPTSVHPVLDLPQVDTGDDIGGGAYYA